MIRVVPLPYKIIEGNGYFPVPKGSGLTVDDFDHSEKLGWLDFIKSDNLVIDNDNSECYKLDIKENRVKIYAPTAVGAFYGFITLMQLSHTYEGKIPCMIIEDKPLYRYRGFLLDVARYFFSVKDVKKLADLLAVHKINKLHLHLTDDQGWRVEIKKYPLLATHGSERSRTNFNLKKQSGFYTQNDIREIVAYCKTRGIEVIPEIDMPGHVQSALSCYPHLGCFDRLLPVAKSWGVKHDILCMGKDSTYRFAYDVIDEIVDLFDSQYIHIGGDEVYLTRTEICPHCQRKMQELGLDSERQLNYYFVKKICAYVQSKGKTPIVWNMPAPINETTDGTLWQVWEPTNDAKALANELNRGKLVINSDSTHLYLDFPYGVTNLEKTYNNPPEIEYLAPDLMAGVECCLWTEYVPDLKKAIFLTLPRLGAICENMWSPKGVRLWGNFKARLGWYYQYMTSLGYEPAPLGRTMPNAYYSLVDGVKWNSRWIHWDGLHNTIDNALVARKAKKQAETKQANNLPTDPTTKIKPDEITDSNVAVEVVTDDETTARADENLEEE